MEKLNVLVTGGTRGIGAGIVRELLSAGHNVMYCARSSPAAESSPEQAEEKTSPLSSSVSPLSSATSSGFPPSFSPSQLSSQGESSVKVGNALFHRCDISSEKERRELISAFLEEFGTLDALVNNAGVAPEKRCDLLEMTPQSFDRVMEINLKGPFFLTQLAAKALLENRTGKFRCIVNIGSVSARCANIERGEYCLSKAGVAMASRLWTARLAKEGIAVYEIRPGIIRSDMTRTVTAKYDRLIEEGLTLQKRWGLPSDVGRAVRMLLSGDLAYSTGQVLNVDGGMLIERF